MKTTSYKKSGFTLVEMTVIIIFALALSSTGLMLIRQQLNTVRIFNEQNFIISETPQINSMLTSLLGRADAIRIHENFSDAVQDEDPVITDGKTLVAAFRNIDNTTSFGIVNFETIAGQEQLTYYFIDADASITSPIEGSPSWSISRQVSDVNFALINGLFEVTLMGPNAEQITYTISPNKS